MTNIRYPHYLIEVVNKAGEVIHTEYEYSGHAASDEAMYYRNKYWDEVEIIVSYIAKEEK
jgi:hypothetical protein